MYSSLTIPESYVSNQAIEAARDFSDSVSSLGNDGGVISSLQEIWNKDRTEWCNFALDYISLGLTRSNRDHVCTGSGQSD